MNSSERARPASIHQLSAAPGQGPPPDIPRPRAWKTRILLPGVLLGGAGALFLAVGADSLRAALPVRVAPVVAKRIAGPVGTSGVQASGWLEPSPFHTYVSALVPGVVSELLVLEGQTVEAGQVVARLIDDEARLRVQETEAALELALAERAVAEARHEGVQARNELLLDRHRDVELETARMNAAEAELSELAATCAAQEKHVAMLRDRHTRTRRVLEGGAASEGDATQQAFALESAAATLEALRRRRAVLEGSREEARARLRAAEQHLEFLVEEREEEAVAAAQLKRARAQVARAEARLADARLALERHSVRALTPGVVMRLTAAPGARLMLEGNRPGASHVLHSYQPERLQVRVDVPLADAAQVGLGQEARVEVETLPERVFRGRVARVVHQADVQKNTVEFKVELETADPQLKPDMLARVRFLASAPEGAPASERLLVPADALSETGTSEATVWVARERRGTRAVAERRRVQLGSVREGGAVEVLAGLRVGDEVVVAPPARLSDGALLAIQGEAP